MITYKYITININRNYCPHARFACMISVWYHNMIWKLKLALPPPQVVSEWELFNTAQNGAGVEKEATAKHSVVQSGSRNVTDVMIINPNTVQKTVAFRSNIHDIFIK
jgi:hypothetical protein